MYQVGIANIFSYCQRDSCPLNSWIWVSSILCSILSSGLPLDISTEEFVEMMSKCGIVMRDPITDEYKVKLYKDKDGNLKGDGLCCFLKVSQIFSLPQLNS